jgi:hypothetical protein
MFASKGEATPQGGVASPLLGHLSVFHHPSLQPFADQADHAAVADPMLDKTDQPLVVDRIERRGDRLPIAGIFPIQ